MWCAVKALSRRQSHHDDGVVVSIQQDGTTEGTISVSGTSVSYNAFTGSHFAWTDQAIERGSLVTLTGSNRRYHDDPESEILYGITTATSANDPRCLGAYLGLQEPSLPVQPRQSAPRHVRRQRRAVGRRHGR